MRIAVIYPLPFLDSTPCLYNLVQSLADAGYEMEVFTASDPRFTTPQFTGDVSLHLFSGSRRGFPAWMAKVADPKRFNAVIAMDRWGMFSAARLLRLSNSIPLIYFNVELYLPPIFKGWKHTVMNRIEAALVRHMARLVLAPSRERGHALRSWYGVESDILLAMPNSPRGVARPEKGDYLQRKYQIEPNRPVILYFGSLTSANRIEELLESARTKWPEDFVLVLHGRQQSDDDSRRWFEDQTRGAKCRIILSLDPLGLEELDLLVHSADIGIALYPTEGTGFQTMGTASGKIAQYLYSGVPVVTSQLYSLQDIFVKYFPDAGATINHADEIPEIARRLLAAGIDSRVATARCFNDVFSFDRHFDAFLTRLKGLLS